MVLIKWCEPKHDDDVDKVQIHRATTKTGIYTEVTELDALDGDDLWVKEYDDTTGSSTSWYKIRFVNSSGTDGEFSEARRAGYVPYFSVDDFREKTLILRGEISDRDIVQILPEVNRAVLDKIVVRVKWEQLTGTADSSNKEFATAHKPIADSDLSMVLDSADADVYEADLTTEDNLDFGTTTITVSSVEQNNGIVNLDASPTTGISGIYANYSYYKQIYEPDTLREAGIYLAAYRLAIRNNLENPKRWLDLYEAALLR